jgi:hypothetical protein
MGSLNPHWLSIELDSIDATTQKWNAAIWASYQATLHALTERQLQEAAQLHLEFFVDNALIEH